MLEEKGWPGGAPARPAFQDAEYPIGIYVNDCVTFGETILFTDQALYLYKDKAWTQLQYAEIAEVSSPNTKSDVAGVSILRHNGREFFVPVRGVRADRFDDAFEVLRFLDRVRTDIGN